MPANSKRRTAWRVNPIARKMMLGISKGMKKPTPDQLEAFKVKYADTISLVDSSFGRKLLASDKFVSLGVLGAIGKSVLWYGKDKMEPFIEALCNGNFTGPTDPAHVLWLWLTSRSNYGCEMAYRKTVAAIRAHVTGRQMARIRDGEATPGDRIHEANSDFFDWNDDYTVMVKPGHQPGNL